MTYRKGELSKGQINREWPYQVSLPAPFVSGAGGAFGTILMFCRANSLSLCERRHTFFRDDQHHIVWCFAEQSHADQFRAKFDGEIYVKPGRASSTKSTKFRP